MIGAKRMLACLTICMRERERDIRVQKEAVGRQEGRQAGREREQEKNRGIGE